MPVTNFVWDRVSGNVRMEVDDAGITTAEYANEPGQFGELISQRRDSVNSFHHYDAQGSTRQLTDDSETVTDTYTYSAFGESVSESGTITNPFRYVGAWGYYTDSETTEIYVRRRTYSPLIARWLSADPLMFVDGPNRYIYVRNEPIHKVDPSGQSLEVFDLGFEDRTQGLSCYTYFWANEFSLNTRGFDARYIATDQTFFWGWGVRVLRNVWVQEVLSKATCTDCDPPITNSISDRIWEWFAPEFRHAIPGLVGPDFEGYYFGVDRHSMGSISVDANPDCVCQFQVDVSSYLGDVVGAGPGLFGVAIGGPTGPTTAPPTVNKDTPPTGVIKSVIAETVHYWGYRVDCTGGFCMRIHEYGFVPNAGLGVRY